MTYLPVHGEEEIYENTVRLHVIAASDSEEDQALKLHVRDRVLECVS
jgi:stage II sporulation protein R